MSVYSRYCSFEKKRCLTAGISFFSLKTKIVSALEFSIAFPIEFPIALEFPIVFPIALAFIFSFAFAFASIFMRRMKKKS